MMMNFKKFNESFKNTYIPKKKPIRESKEAKPLSEGAGAGYTIEGNIDDAVVREILSVSKDEDNVFTYKIDSFASLKDIKAYSYYYGEELPEADIRVSSISLVFYDEEGNEDKNPAVLPENLEYIINHLKLKATIGAGWLHHTFDGVIEASNNDLDKPESDYDYDVIGLHLNFEDADIIQYIDDAVTGELELSDEEEDDFVESYGVMSDYLKESLERENNSVFK